MKKTKVSLRPDQLLVRKIGKLIERSGFCGCVAVIHEDGPRIHSSIGLGGKKNNLAYAYQKLGDALQRDLE